MEIFAGLFVFALVGYGVYKFVNREKAASKGGRPSGGSADVKEK